MAKFDTEHNGKVCLLCCDSLTLAMHAHCPLWSVHHMAYKWDKISHQLYTYVKLSKITLLPTTSVSELFLCHRKSRDVYISSRLHY